MRHAARLSGAIAERWRLLCVRATALLLVVLMCGGGSSAYSVLTHEEIVNLLWTDEIRPPLLKRYPGLSEDQLKQAHAYACGGAHWQGVLTALDQLKSVAPASTVAGNPAE